MFDELGRADQLNCFYATGKLTCLCVYEAILDQVGNLRSGGVMNVWCFGSHGDRG